MLTYLRSHHVGLLALFLALTGTSYAVATGSINSREIRNNTVKSRDIRNNSITGRDIRNGRVSSRDLRDGSASGADLRDGSVSGADIADGSLNGADVANGGLTGQDIRSNSLGDADIAPNAISADEIRANAVRSEEVQNGSLRGEDFASGALATNAVVRFDDFAVAGGDTGTEEIACSAGERAVGGGVSFEGARNDADIVTFSEPRAGTNVPGQGAAANGWAAGIRNGDTVGRTARVWVSCAS
jgi:hypothetical protein